MLSTAYAKAPTDVEAFTTRAVPGGVALGAIQTAWTFPEKALVTKTLNTSVPKTSLNVIPRLYQATMSLNWFHFLTTWSSMDFFFFRERVFTPTSAQTTMEILAQMWLFLNVIWN